jgi:dihydroceramidase
LSLVTILIVAPEVRRWLFAVVLVAAIVMEMVFARKWRPGAGIAFYLWGLAATATAFGIWVLDQDAVVCAPHSLIQGHAVWHLLGAASLWLSFSYYRSERRHTAL